jgi:mycothiol synthase
MTTWRIEAQPGLSNAQYEQVERLQSECEAAGGLDLKLELTRTEASAADDTLMAYAGEQLVGYCGVDAGTDAEVCGMIHPDHRRRGIGTALLDRVLMLAARAHKDSALIICEDASSTAIDWLRRRGATLHQSEFRMVLNLDTAPSPGAVATRLTTVSSDTRAALVRLLVDAFAETPASVNERLERSQRSAGEETLIAYEGEKLIGTTRLLTTARRSMIYGFVVDRALRGQGHGRSMMQATLKLLQERRVEEVGLEVEPENVPAVRLYRSFGFRVVTTYRYMRLPV